MPITRGWLPGKRRDGVVIAGYMFITETPYDERDGHYQLSVDLPGIADERVCSPTMILDAEKNNSATKA